MDRAFLVASPPLDSMPLTILTAVARASPLAGAGAVGAAADVAAGAVSLSQGYLKISCGRISLLSLSVSDPWSQ